MFDPTAIPGYIAGPVDWSAEFGHVHVAAYIDAERGEEL